jgi:hypothetical protein
MFSDYKQVSELISHPHFTANIAVDTAIINPDNSASQNVYRSKIARAFARDDSFENTVLKTSHAFSRQCKVDDRLDLYKSLVLPLCRAIALQTAAVPEGNRAEKLLDYAQVVFMQANAADSSALHTATLQLASYYQQNLCSSNKNAFLALFDYPKNDPANASTLLPIWVQLFVGLSTSLPLLLGNSLVALYRDKAAKEVYLENPAAAVSSLLRCAGPAQVVFRYATQDTTIYSKTISKGERVALFLAQANLDKKVFPSTKKPLQTGPNRSLSLGKGRHACLGGAMVRKALQIIPAVVFSYFEGYKIVESSLKWGGSDTIKGIISFEIERCL